MRGQANPASAKRTRAPCRKSGSSVKNDPSRFLARRLFGVVASASAVAWRAGDGVARDDDDKRVADPDDRVARRQCADDVGERRAVAGRELAHDKRRCNNTARDHKRDRQKNAPDTSPRDKSVGGKAQPGNAPTSQPSPQHRQRLRTSGTITARLLKLNAVGGRQPKTKNPGCVNNRGYYFV